MVTTRPAVSLLDVDAKELQRAGTAARGSPTGHRGAGGHRTWCGRATERHAARNGKEVWHLPRPRGSVTSLEQVKEASRERLHVMGCHLQERSRRQINGCREVEGGRERRKDSAPVGTAFPFGVMRFWN